MSAASTSGSATTPPQSRPSDSSVFTIALVFLLVTLVGIGSFAFIACGVGAQPQPNGAGVYNMPTRF